MRRTASARHASITWLHRSANLGTSYESLNAGLGIVQFYAGMSTHPTDLTRMFGGFQDNGSCRRDAGLSWTHVTGGDGGWTQINQSNPVVVFTESQGTGNLYRSTNGGTTFTDAGAGLSGLQRTTTLALQRTLMGSVTALAVIALAIGGVRRLDALLAAYALGLLATAVLSWRAVHHAVPALRFGPWRLRRDAVRELTHVGGTLQATHLVAQAQRRLERLDARFRQAAQSLNTLSPLATLARGYAIVERLDDGAVVREASAVKPGERVRARLARGELECRVEKTNEN